MQISRSFVSEKFRTGPSTPCVPVRTASELTSELVYISSLLSDGFESSLAPHEVSALAASICGVRRLLERLIASRSRAADTGTRGRNVLPVPESLPSHLNQQNHHRVIALTPLPLSLANYVNNVPSKPRTAKPHHQPPPAPGAATVQSQLAPAAPGAATVQSQFAPAAPDVTGIIPAPLQSAVAPGPPPPLDLGGSVVSSEACVSCNQLLGKIACTHAAPAGKDALIGEDFVGPPLRLPGTSMARLVSTRSLPVMAPLGVSNPPDSDFAVPDPRAALELPPSTDNVPTELPQELPGRNPHDQVLNSPPGGLLRASVEVLPTEEPVLPGAQPSQRLHGWLRSSVESLMGLSATEAMVGLQEIVSDADDERVSPEPTGSHLTGESEIRHLSRLAAIQQNTATVGSTDQRTLTLGGAAVLAANALRNLVLLRSSFDSRRPDEQNYAEEPSVAQDPPVPAAFSDDVSRASVHDGLLGEALQPEARRRQRSVHFSAGVSASVYVPSEPVARTLSMTSEDVMEGLAEAL